MIGLIVTFCALTVTAGQQITLTNNGYDNILVAISDTVSYDADIIPAIQVS